MARLGLSSWLHPKPATTTTTTSSADAEKLKTKRKSLAAFTSTLKETSNPKENGTGTKTNGHRPPTADMDLRTTPSNATEAPPPSRMMALAQTITEETKKLEAYLTAHDLPLPSFDVDAPADYPKLPADIAKSRNAIIVATKELGLLAHGPRESVRWAVWEFLDVLALQLINHFGIAKLVPLTHPIPLSTLSTLTRLDPINLARALRLVMTKGLFREPSPNLIAHTAASRALAEDADLEAWLGFNADDIFPAAAHVLEAITAYPEATSLTRSGFCFAFDTVDKEPMFVTFGKDANRARRMGRAMASLTGGEGYEVRYLLDVEGGGYDFGEVDARGGTLVDVGGSVGFVAVEMARRYRNMKFVVQDLPKTVESAPRPVDGDEQVAGRVRLMAHDFWGEQSVKGADVYFFRWILHNYSTPYALQILKNIIPALKPGARIIINDHCLREAGAENPWDEIVMRRMDVVMLALLNAQERTEEEYRELFRAASENFVFLGVTRPKGCRMSIIEAVWQPKEEEETPTTSGGITPSPVAESDGEEMASAAPLSGVDGEEVVTTATARIAGDN